MINNRKKIALLIPLLAVFLIIGFMVKGSAEGILFDLSILELLHRNTSPIIFKIMKFISFIGSWKILLPGTAILIVYLLNKRQYYSSKLLLINILGSYIINFILKNLFQRTRPLEFFRVEQSGLSFPSGHSMVTMSMYLAIAYLLTKDRENTSKRKLIYGLSTLLILLMGISRVYLGVHWPTDIIGGYIMGYLFFNLSLILIK